LALACSDRALLFAANYRLPALLRKLMTLGFDPSDNTVPKT